MQWVTIVSVLLCLSAFGTGLAFLRQRRDWRIALLIAGAAVLVMLLSANVLIEVFGWSKEEDLGTLLWFAPVVGGLLLSGAAVVEMLIALIRRKQRARWRDLHTLARATQQRPGMAYRCHHDQRWTMAFVSEGCLDLTGYAPVDLVGTSFHPDDFVQGGRAAYWDLIHPSDRETVWQELGRAIAGERPYTLTYRVVRQDGQVRWVDDAGSIYRDEENNQLILEGFAADATKRRAREQKQRERFEDYQRLAEHAPDLWAIHGPEGHFLYVSPSCQALLGYPPAELEGQRMYAFCHPDDVANLHLETHTTLHKTTSHSQYRFRTEAGEYRWLETEAVSVFDGEGRVVRLVSYSRDVTERKKQEAALVEARDRAEEMNRLKTAFLSKLSHELRGPLAGMLGFSNLLEREIPEPLQELVQNIEHGGRRLQESLDSVFDLSMLEADEPRRPQHAVNIMKEVQTQVQHLKDLAAEKELELDITTSTPEPTVRVDRTYLQRVLDNLVRSAIKASEAGKVTVDLSEDNGDLSIQVGDTGLSFREDQLEHLFDETGELSEEYSNGRGVELALAKRLVEMMGGELSVTPGKERGNVFTVRLPEDKETEASASPPAERPAAPAMRPPEDHPAAPSAGMMKLPHRPRILAVDDNSQMRILIEGMLRPAVDIVVVADEESALKKAEEIPFDLILMDINLGRDRTGIDVMKTLRTMPAYRDAPILAVTAYALPKERAHFLEAGFNGYVGKPFTKAQLLQAINRFVRIPPLTPVPMKPHSHAI